MLAFIICCAVGAATSGNTTPTAEVIAVLRDFRTEPPRGWSFTQTTAAQGQSTVERNDAAQPEFARWTLIQKDGRAPTADELRHYAEARSRRSRGGTAPRLVEQLELASLEILEDTAERARYRFRLRPIESGDKTAAFLRAVVAFHPPTRTIESIELVSVGPFSPTFGVKIEVMRTLMTYSLPKGATPSLPQKVTTHVRGTAFWLKSLDADMTVEFSDYHYAWKK